MKKTEDIITLTKNSAGKLRSTPDTLFLLAELEKKYDTVSFVRIGEKKARSLKQNGIYWSAWLPVFCNHIDGMDQFVKLDHNNKFNYDIAHRWLTLRWASEKNRMDLIQMIPVYMPDGLIERAGVVSMSFDKANNKDACDYYDWLHFIFNQKTKMSLDDMCREEGHCV